MLRLTHVSPGSDPIRLKVEGTITRATLSVLAAELRRVLDGPGRIQLDFRDVVYLDSSGLELLRNLPQDRVEIVDCTPLIRELLSKELA
jgi:ABC-type transporter Mla MlaB component